MSQPRLKGSVGDFGLGHMVDDDGQIRIALDELDGVSMCAAIARVEPQARVLDRPDGGIRSGLEVILGRS